jgi:hypothetical protein
MEAQKQTRRPFVRPARPGAERDVDICIAAQQNSVARFLQEIPESSGHIEHDIFLGSVSSTGPGIFSPMARIKHDFHFPYSFPRRKKCRILSKTRQAAYNGIATRNFIPAM